MYEFDSLWLLEGRTVHVEMSNMKSAGFLLGAHCHPFFAMVSKKYIFSSLFETKDIPEIFEHTLAVLTFWTKVNS